MIQAWEMKEFQAGLLDTDSCKMQVPVYIKSDLNTWMVIYIYEVVWRSNNYFFIKLSSEQVVDDLPTAIAATSISITDNQFHSRI